MPRLQVGSVPYAVARPLDAALEGHPDLDLVREVPAALVERLRAGSLDVALVSSVELFRRPGYRYLAGPVVGTRGRVSSVQLFRRRPLAEVRTIAMDPASRTSAALVRALLDEEPGETPRFLETDGDPREADADGWLRIGDRALLELHAPDAPATFNPSEEWCRRTRLPFVFALWIARPDVDLESWAPVFGVAARRGAGGLEDLATRTAVELGLPEAPLRAYFLEECAYRLPPDEVRASLLAFRDRLAPLGLVEAALDPSPVPVAEGDDLRVP